MNNIFTLNLYGQGVVTLPKSWREKWATKKFVARDEGRQLIIEPIDKETNLKMITENPAFDFLKDEPDLYHE